MFGQITALLTEIRDAIQHSNDMATAWTEKQTQWREKDVQRRQDEDNTMKRYIAAMEEANKQAATETARKNHKKLPATPKETVTNDAV